jgi:hypothetical protein
MFHSPQLNIFLVDNTIQMEMTSKGETHYGEYPLHALPKWQNAASTVVTSKLAQHSSLVQKNV